MKISVRYSPSDTGDKRTTIDLDDLELTREQWDQMSNEEREEKIQLYVDGFDQPFYSVDSFEAE